LEPFAMDSQKQARLEALSRHRDRLAIHSERLLQLDQRFFLLRVGTLLGGGALSLGLLFWGPGRSGLWVSASTLLAFTLVVILHRRVDQARLHFHTALSQVSSQIARMTLDWDQIPEPPASFIDALYRKTGYSKGTHPFSSDLDLFGGRSIHPLLDTATSLGGSLRLAEWLLAPVPDPEHIHYRRALILEMLGLTGFRTHLAFKSRLVREQVSGYWNAERLLKWLDESSSPSLIPVLVTLSALAVLNVALVILNISQYLPAYWIWTVALYAFIYLYRYRDYETLFEDTYKLGESLAQLRGVLEYLERYPYASSSELGKLCTPFTDSSRRPSVFLRKIVWITSAASLGNNMFLAFFFNAILPWNFIFSHLLNRYKSTLKKCLPVWLDTWYELEALNSLANFSYLNPIYTFPEIVAGTGEPDSPVFEASALGHPLIPDSVKVCNDYSIQSLGEIAIITGSNMSGKSTFLRTLGVNLCLAYTGGPVSATYLNTILFRLYTVIQVSDSLSNGISYFYAEVRRLKALLDKLSWEGDYPLFFLIDEIFRGTNNRERRIGSRSYIRSLSRGRGVGLISTHDLELVKLADEIPAIQNYHFREEVIDGRMVFDFRLYPGPSPTTNALKIMQMEGLPVDD
jgi:hypothetical protein